LKTPERIMKYVTFIPLVLLFAGCATGRGGEAGMPLAPFERVSDGQRIGFQTMLGELAQARLLFIGELHDNREHHRLQLETIKALHRSGVRIAIGLEMFRVESQQYLDHWVAGKLDVLTFMEIYRDNWTIPWELYDSIFLYARNNGIPLIGLNAPRKIMQKVYRQGFAALTPEERGELPPDVTCRVDKPYMDFVRRNFVMHSPDPTMFIHFCEAQLLRNKVMADRLVSYLAKEPERVVVVLAGVGHAMRRGVPDEVEGLRPLQMRIVMPLLHEAAAEPLDKGDADYVVRE